MVPNWLYGKRIGIWDLETDYIPTTLIYMNGVSFIDIDTEGNITITPSKVYTYEWTPYSNGSLMESLVPLMKCDYICGHNLIGFDQPQIKQHLGMLLDIPVLDTLILAKIMISKDDLYAIDSSLDLLDTIDWQRPYALDAFGKRLGDNKLVFKEFSQMTEEMAIYCNQDVNLTSKLLLHLMAQENFPLEQVIDIEHKAAAIIAIQATNGFYIDIELTRALNTKLLTEKGELARDLADIFSPKFLREGQSKTYAKPSKVKKYLPNPNFKGW